MAMVDVAAPSPEKNPPRVRVEFSKRDVKQLVGMKPGAVVTLTITGKVVEVNVREPYDEETGFVGDLVVEAKTTKLKDVTKSSVADLVDDDEDE